MRVSQFQRLAILDDDGRARRKEQRACEAKAIEFVAALPKEERQRINGAYRKARLGGNEEANRSYGGWLLQNALPQS